MKPSKITIQGDYWDCQIYRGRLHLWTLDGGLKIIDWYALVDSLEENIHQHMPLACAFTDGNYLYNFSLQKIFGDPDFKALLQQKFASITNSDFVIEQADLGKFAIGIQDNPFKELHIDSEISANQVYALTENSLQSATAHRQDKKYPVSSKPVNIFSINAFSFKANNYSKFAISSGADGLFEFDAFVAKKSRFRNGDTYLKRVLESHSSFADYSFLSIYNSSLIGSSCMAYQLWDGDKIANSSSQLFSKIDRSSIRLEKMIPEVEIFKSTNKSKLSWGNNEKLYRATDAGIELVKFTNYVSDNVETFSELDLIDVRPNYGAIINARTAYFGSIIEYESALVILLSDDSQFVIEGPITRWRIYPRSYNYENHLHVIKDDCIEIYSFNNDYFIDQEKKKLGISYRIRKPFGYRQPKIVISDDTSASTFSDFSTGHTSLLSSEDLPF